MTKINLRVSEVSSIIGYNPYANIKTTILRLWQKADQQDYFSTIFQLVKKGIIENPFIRDEDVIETYSKKYNINLFKELNLCQKATSTQELEKYKNEIFKNIDNNQNINENDKNKIKESLHELAKMNYGIHHENIALDCYCKKYKIKVDEQQKYTTKLIAYSETYQWYISGKVDGIREDNILVEVKNRINRLGGTLKPYENIQIQIYLHLFGLNKGHLVESLKQNNKRQINVIEVDYDKNKWIEIKHKLSLFLEFFYQFIDSDNLKYFFLTKSDEEINKYYKSIINQTLT